MKYLIKNNNVCCLLTTHFAQVCNNLENTKNIKNFHMDAKKTNQNIEYTYQLKKGISTVKGGVNVLHNMNYPKEILDNCCNL
jgi:DNA mismatch repair ATPase MutS